MDSKVLRAALNSELPSAETKCGLPRVEEEEEDEEEEPEDEGDRRRSTLGQLALPYLGLDVLRLNVHILAQNLARLPEHLKAGSRTTPVSIVSLPCSSSRISIRKRLSLMWRMQYSSSWCASGVCQRVTI
jgi:hypothetical protein